MLVLRCDLNQKFHNTKDILLFFLFFHVNFLRWYCYINAGSPRSQDGCRQRPGLYIVLFKPQKREICCSRKSHVVWTASNHMSTTNLVGCHDLGQSTYPIALVRNEVKLNTKHMALYGSVRFPKDSCVILPRRNGNICWAAKYHLIYFIYLEDP